jgi:hypothetical protein
VTNILNLHKLPQFTRETVEDDLVVSLDENENSFNE